MGQIEKYKRENVLLQSKSKQIERALDKQVRNAEDRQPRIDQEIRNLRTKLNYMAKKYETEYNKLIELSTKRKEMKVREGTMMRKETTIIENARRQHGIDFENPTMLARKAREDEMRDEFNQMQRKVDILASAISSQNRKFKQRTKQQKLKLDGLKDLQKEIEHKIAIQESTVEEK